MFKGIGRLFGRSRASGPAEDASRNSDPWAGCSYYLNVYRPGIDECARRLAAAGICVNARFNCVDRRAELVREDGTLFAHVSVGGEFGESYAAYIGTKEGKPIPLLDDVFVGISVYHRALS